jgi:hypothetical protein
VRRAPVGEVHDHLSTEDLFDPADQLQQAHRVRRPAAEIERAAGDVADPPEGVHVGVDGVVDEQDVAHLPAVAVDGDRFARQGADQEVGDPSLVLGAHLMRAVDAAHPQHAGGHTEAARIVEHVLVGRAL